MASRKMQTTDTMSPSNQSPNGNEQHQHPDYEEDGTQRHVSDWWNGRRQTHQIRNFMRETFDALSNDCF